MKQKRKPQGEEKSKCKIPALVTRMDLPHLFFQLYNSFPLEISKFVLSVFVYFLRRETTKRCSFGGGE